MTKLYDIRFAFNHDNPFRNDIQHVKVKNLKQYLSAHHEQFVEVNYLNDSRYLILCPDRKKLFNVNVYNTKTNTLNTDISNNPLINVIKDFIATTPGISSELKAWASRKSSIKEDVTPSPSPASNRNDGDASDNFTSEDTNEAMEANEQIESFVPLMSNKFTYQVSTAYTNYDISNDKSITYEDLRKITINLARSKLVPEIAKDETVIALEREKRKQLIQQITRYRAVKVIAALNDSDLNDMDLAQLEACLEECKKLHENFKTIELFKRGFNCGGLLYDMLFPEGIPVTKTKRLCFKGIGKEILGTLFDSQTPVGLAFSNILQKHNIHVSDELVTLVAFGGICVSKVKVESIKPEQSAEDLTVHRSNYVSNNTLKNARIEDLDYEYETDSYE